MSKELATFRFIPTTLEHRIEFAKMLAHADLLPYEFRKNPANVLLAMEYGDSLAIPYIQAITTINVIEGKPSASAGLISALVRRAGHKLRVVGDDTRATATIVRADDPDFEYRSTWTVERAQKAGLVELRDGKPWARSKRGKVLPWEAYTASLLKARAITEVSRDGAQEALMGIMYTPEELGAHVDEDGRVIDADIDSVASVAVTASRAHAGQRNAQPTSDDTAEASEVAHDASSAADGADDSDEPVDDLSVDSEPETVGPLSEQRLSEIESDTTSDEDAANLWSLSLAAAESAANMEVIMRLANIAKQRGMTVEISEAQDAWRRAAPRASKG